MVKVQGKMQVDEWTVVHRKKQRFSQQRGNKRRDQNIAKAKALAGALSIGNETNILEANEAASPSQQEITALCQAIEKCMHDLQNVSPDSDHDIFESILLEVHNALTKNTISENVDEIVCYGIGNFDITTSYSTYHSLPVPMVQLACILLLRHSLAVFKKDKLSSCNLTDIQQSKNREEQILLSYSQQQRLVSMVYFEPCIRPIEKIVLSQYFNILILEENEMGKRCIENTSNDHNKTEKSVSLFYMPHNPMRLYSNVLWSNWHLLPNGRVIIFGNSFQEYNDRIIGLKSDETNCLVPVLKFIEESKKICHFRKMLRSADPLKHKSKRSMWKPSALFDDARKHRYSDITNQNIEMAFNDCVVISFRQIVSDRKRYECTKIDLPWPPRPKEYIVDPNNLEDELL